MYKYNYFKADLFIFAVFNVIPSFLNDWITKAIISDMCLVLL